MTQPLPAAFRLDGKVALVTGAKDTQVSAVTGTRRESVGAWAAAGAPRSARRSAIPEENGPRGALEAFWHPPDRSRVAAWNGRNPRAKPPPGRRGLPRRLPKLPFFPKKSLKILFRAGRAFANPCSNAVKTPENPEENPRNLQRTRDIPRNP